MKKVIFLFLFLSFFPVNSAFSVVGYRITEYSDANANSKNTAIKCYNESTQTADEAICQKYFGLHGAQCSTLASTETNGTDSIMICQPMEYKYCFTDEDCNELGKGTCVAKKGSNMKFDQQFKSEEEIFSDPQVIGICASVGGSGEDNAFGQAICNLMNVVTGNAGRAVVGVVVIVVGIMFFLGKVTWSLVLAIALGAGAIFGAPAIVKIVTGKAFTCR